MKSRSREINVFSMSALDLFASALGAFILIAIVLMPFYLHVDPDEVNRVKKALAQAQAAQAETQRQLQQSRSANARIRQELQELLDAPKFRFPALDIVIALDTTGSMRDEVAGLRDEIDQFARLMLELSPTLALGAIDFKDRCEGSNAVRSFSLRLMNSAALSNLVAFTRTMSPGGSDCNTDSPEALAMALDTAIASRWRPDSEARIIVVITDNPAYPERQAHALSAARAFASRGPEFKVSVVLRGDHIEFLRRLADAGNGKYIGSGASFTATMLLAIAGL